MCCLNLGLNISFTKSILSVGGVMVIGAEIGISKQCSNFSLVCYIDFCTHALGKGMNTPPHTHTLTINLKKIAMV